VTDDDPIGRCYCEKHQPPEDTAHRKKQKTHAKQSEEEEKCEVCPGCNEEFETEDMIYNHDGTDRLWCERCFRANETELKEKKDRYLEELKRKDAEEREQKRLKNAVLEEKRREEVLELLNPDGETNLRAFSQEDRIIRIGTQYMICENDSFFGRNDVRFSFEEVKKLDLDCLTNGRPDRAVTFGSTAPLPVLPGACRTGFRCFIGTSPQFDPDTGEPISFACLDHMKHCPRDCTENHIFDLTLDNYTFINGNPMTEDTIKVIALM